jgi:hypothetical protein
MPWRFHNLNRSWEDQAMHMAYEKDAPHLVFRPMPDRITEILVTEIVELSKTESDPDQLCKSVLAYYRASEA